MLKFNCILWFFVIILQWITGTVPFRYRCPVGDSGNETHCIVGDRFVYQDGDSIPTGDPCELCKCKAPDISCVSPRCYPRGGCVMHRKGEECCHESCPPHVSALYAALYKSSTAQSVSETPTNTTPLTTSTASYTTISSMTPSTTRESTTSTIQVIIASPSSKGSTSSPVDRTRTNVHWTTSPWLTTTRSASQATSSAITTTHSQIIISSIAIDSATSPPIMKEQKTMSTSESETLVSSESLIESVTKAQALREFTNPWITESAQSSSDEYSTIGIIEDSPQEDPSRTEWLKLQQFIKSNPSRKWSARELWYRLKLRAIKINFN